jgi:hypothetical protein
MEGRMSNTEDRIAEEEAIRYIEQQVIAPMQRVIIPLLLIGVPIAAILYALGI